MGVLLCFLMLIASGLVVWICLGAIAGIRDKEDDL
jgi:hypothetical protein